jgi:hypothetical protein
VSYAAAWSTRTRPRRIRGDEDMGPLPYGTLADLFRPHGGTYLDIGANIGLTLVPIDDTRRGLSCV